MKLKTFKYIDVLIDNPNSWMWQYIKVLEDTLIVFVDNIRFFNQLDEIKNGDILFILSCDRILGSKDLSKHKNNIVIHASDLPKGRGWSPWSWEVEHGVDFLTLTLFEADLILDSGGWYLKERLNLDGSELVEEIRKKLALKEFDMIKTYLTNYPIDAKEQLGDEVYYERRTYKNQELDIDKSIREQFNKLRVCDNENYPAYFFMDTGVGKIKFTIKIDKITGNNSNI